MAWRSRQRSGGTESAARVKRPGRPPVRSGFPEQLAGYPMTRFHLHLVSDATGDTVHSVARACLVQFEGAEAIEHVWSMVRTKSQIERVIAGVQANPGVVLYTLVNETLRQPLVDGCRRVQVPVIPV